MYLVYIAGKYRDDQPYKVYGHIERAWQMGCQVNALGSAYAMIPHKNSEHMEGLRGPQFWIDATLEMMRRCDAVMIIPGTWETSTGTKGEIAEAERLGIPVFYDIENLEQWLVKQEEVEKESSIVYKIKEFISGPFQNYKSS